MTMTTTTVNEEAAKADQLIKTLYAHIRAFERAQGSVKKRLRDIKQGTLSPKRTPTATLVDQRAQTRATFREFLDGLSQEEKTILTIANGRNWRSEYDDLLDPAKDPEFE